MLISQVPSQALDLVVRFSCSDKGVSFLQPAPGAKFLPSSVTADREEWEQEAEVALGMRKVLQSLAQVAEKLKQEVARLQGQEKESWLQQGQNQRPQIWNPPRKVRPRHWQEFS